MREIKFRFWSKILDKFVIPHDSIFVGALKDPDMNPMQFTGLHDKNGKEIYEGDTVKYIYPYRRNNGKVYDTNRKQVVKWVNSRQHTGFNLGNPNVGNLEVIGNIYENPELIK